MNLTKSYNNITRNGGFFFSLLPEIHQWINLALAGLNSPFISFAFTQSCLLNLEPSRQYNKRSCKCLNRGLLDFGVPNTPLLPSRPQEDWFSFLPQSSFTPGCKCLEILRDFSLSHVLGHLLTNVSLETNGGYSNKDRSVKGIGKIFKSIYFSSILN